MLQWNSLTTTTTTCRGLKYVSKFRSERIVAIAEALASSEYDVITLQEVWVYGDFELIRNAVSNRMPYSKFFYRCVTVHCHGLFFISRLQWGSWVRTSHSISFPNH